MKDFINYAPYILIVIAFLTQYKIFVTPSQLTDYFTNFEEKIDKKFVHKEVYNLAITELKSDIVEIKEKIDKMYDKIMRH